VRGKGGLAGKDALQRKRESGRVRVLEVAGRAVAQGIEEIAFILAGHGLAMFPPRSDGAAVIQRSGQSEKVLRGR